ncbi:hypothetical protein AAF712_005918 [Marasmius tenuissimus]|uniref:Uncharacterized protein n=1 Tax=Marasmius tenuissimus TaxID=585030 RepID=A0ABR3A0V5_9AGAR
MSSAPRNSTPRSKKLNDRQKGSGDEMANGCAKDSPEQVGVSNGKAKDTLWSEGSGESEIDEPDSGSDDGDQDSDDEEQTDTGTDSQAPTTTITPALRKKFQWLYNSRGSDKVVFEWKKRNNNNKCDRCASYDLPCTSNLSDRKTVCNECGATRARTCSRTDKFRKDNTMSQMGISEGLFEALKRAYFGDKKETWTKKGKNKRQAVKRRDVRGEENVEEDELESDDEDVQQGSDTVAMEVVGTALARRNPNTKRDSKGLQPKRKRTTSSDGGEPVPPAKKAKPHNQVEVVITKPGVDRIREQALRARRNDSVITVPTRPAKSSERQTNPRSDRVQEAQAANDIEPVDNVTRGSKRKRHPTERAKHAQGEKKKSKKYRSSASRDTTMSHSAGLTPDLTPVETATTSRAPPTIDATKAIARSRPIPVATSRSPESTAGTTATPSTSATMIATRRPLTSSASASTSTTCVLYSNLIQNTVSAPSACPLLNVPTTPAPARSLQRPQTRPIPPELSLSVLKRALEDISSDLRYDRIDVPSAMAKFDDVAERIGKRATFCLTSGAP